MFKERKNTNILKMFMQKTGEKNEITATNIVLDGTDWVIKNLRRYLISQNIKIYCIQMKDKDGSMGIIPDFYSTFDEAMKRAEQVKTEEDETTEGMVDLLFRP